MRELILKRIEEIRNKEDGFNKSFMKWSNFSIGINETHISEIDFSLCDDVELLMLFEHIINRFFFSFDS
jgi:hypothetical protein